MFFLLKYTQQFAHHNSSNKDVNIGDFRKSVDLLAAISG
jgi:hypothetical protein